MTDWILKNTESYDISENYKGNYAFVAIGRLISENTIYIVVNDDIFTITISNPKFIYGYDCLIYGYINNSLSEIRIEDMIDIPKSYLINTKFTIPFVFVNPEMAIKRTKSKNGTILGFENKEVYLSLKIPSFKQFYQPLYILDKIKSNEEDIYSENMKKKRTQLKYQLEGRQLGSY